MIDVYQLDKQWVTIQGYAARKGIELLCSKYIDGDTIGLNIVPETIEDIYDAIDRLADKDSRVSDIIIVVV